MAAIIWSPDAMSQLSQIADYIAQDSHFYAKRVVVKMIQATRRLEHFPESGAVVPELGDATVREIRVFSYRILYRWHENLQRVHILGVTHGSRDVREI